MLCYRDSCALENGGDSGGGGVVAARRMQDASPTASQTATSGEAPCATGAAAAAEEDVVPAPVVSAPRPSRSQQWVPPVLACSGMLLGIASGSAHRLHARQRHDARRCAHL
jgi:hypothetical protein